MPYVRNRKLTWGSERLYYILEPLLPEDFKLKRGKYSEKEINNIFEKIKKESRNKFKTSPLKIYREYHGIIKSKIPELKDYTNRFTTNSSVNWTEPDRKHGLIPGFNAFDPFANESRYFEEILKMMNDLSNEFDGKHYEKEVWHPVGPFIFPITFKKDNNIFLVHAFEDVVNEINEKFKDAIGFGSTRRYMNRNEPQYGNYEFSLILLSPSTAKSARIGIHYGHYNSNFVKRNLIFLPDDIREKFEKSLDSYSGDILSKEMNKEFDRYYENVIEKSTYVNRQLITNAIENSLLKPLELKEFTVVAMRSSYVFDIFSNLNGYNLIDWNLMENTEMSLYGEADPKAISRIKGGLWNDWMQS